MSEPVINTRISEAELDIMERYMAALKKTKSEFVHEALQCYFMYLEDEETRPEEESIVEDGSATSEPGERPMSIKNDKGASATSEDAKPAADEKQTCAHPVQDSLPIETETSGANGTSSTQSHAQVHGTPSGPFSTRELLEVQQALQRTCEALDRKILQSRDAADDAEVRIENLLGMWDSQIRNLKTQSLENLKEWNDKLTETIRTVHNNVQATFDHFTTQVHHELQLDTKKALQPIKEHKRDLEDLLRENNDLRTIPNQISRMTDRIRKEASKFTRAVWTGPIVTGVMIAVLLCAFLGFQVVQKDHQISYWKDTAGKVNDIILDSMYPELTDDQRLLLLKYYHGFNIDGRSLQASVDKSRKSRPN